MVVMKAARERGPKVPFCMLKIVLQLAICYDIFIQGGNMYIIKLDVKNGNMLHVLYNYQGFKATSKLEEATKFKTLEEATNLLNAMQGILKTYKEAQIHKVK